MPADDNGHNKTPVKSQACIRATLISDCGLIVIKNTGQTDARNVRIVLDGIPIENYPGIFLKRNYFTLPAQSTIAIQASVNTELFPSNFIEITWDDNEGEQKSYRIPLYF